MNRSISLLGRGCGSCAFEAAVPARVDETVAPGCVDETAAPGCACVVADVIVVAAATVRTAEERWLTNLLRGCSMCMSVLRSCSELAAILATNFARRMPTDSRPPSY